MAASGADAVICQDLAVATLIGKIAPELPRHGSTQMSVHTLQGALELKELGFTRVVLARELSLPEVEHITQHCGIETECFVHGALCMSMSGQCYMSAFLGGRSGNRGSCAGPCRLPFEANTLPEGKPGRLHHLSLKDNSVIDQLDKLQALGVASAKIEGRLRTPEYVAAAVSACLAGREGRAYDRDLLKNAFSRSGFTSGYLNGKIDGTMFGVRSEADAELTKKTLPALRELYRRERSRVPVRMKLEIEEGGEKLTVTDADGNKAFAYGDNVMYKTTAYGENVYSWLVIVDKGEAFDKAMAEANIMQASATAEEVKQSYDVNETGLVDINDAQLTYDIYSGKYTDFEKVSVRKFLRADVNLDKAVNSADAVAVVKNSK